jgi:phosphatidate cytidylyltransferase
MHAKRWITALVALPFLIALILKGGPTVFALFVTVAATIALWEYFQMVFASHQPAVPLYYTLWSYAAGIAIILTIQPYGLKAAAAVLAIHLIGAGFLSIFRYGISADAPVVAVKQVFGVFYVPLFLSYAVMLYGDPNGVHWVFLLLLVVAAGDTGAYYVGSYWGRHKLCPAVSPKKTVEGALGGLVANIIVGAGYTQLFLPFVSLPACLLFAVVVGAVGQAGDLFESEFKRSAGIKDSGKLLPGHGGFLDRIDALLFAAPTAYLLKEYLLT